MTESATETEKKTKDFKLIPLYDPAAVLKNWKFLSEGLEIVLNYTKGDSSEAKIVNEILTGQLLLWIGFYDNIYCGFVTTQIEVIPNAQDKYLNIKQLFIKQGMDKEVFFGGFTLLKEFATKWQCNKLRFWTMRRGWEKKLLNKGWKQTYMEYNYIMKGGDNIG